jgi:hypothetical protein
MNDNTGFRGRPHEATPKAPPSTRGATVTRYLLYEGMKAIGRSAVNSPVKMSVLA